jgi:hypothetical protein
MDPTQVPDTIESTSLKIANVLVLLIDLATIIVQLDLYWVHAYQRHLWTPVLEKKLIS